MNVGQDTTLGNGDMAQELVQFLIVPDGELEMAGNDTGLLVVASCVASQLKNLSGKVLEDGSQVDGSAGADTLGVVALAEQTVDTTDGERQTGLGRTARRKMARSATRAGIGEDASSAECNAAPCAGAKDAGSLRPAEEEAGFREMADWYLRLRVLGTAGLAAGLAASSHFESWFGGGKKWEKLVCLSPKT